MIGRTKEIAILENAYQSNRPEMIAVIGRRRVGKTYLIRSFFDQRIDFEMVGLKDGNNERQLRNFVFSLEAVIGRPLKKGEMPKDWLGAFHLLRKYLESLKKEDKKVVFIDELPWAATARSDFFTGLSYFWNSYASKANIIFIICGSATAWMIKKVINNKGGLHNRVTRKIILRPFSLAETAAYFRARQINFNQYQLVQLYMTMGGIPHYLDQVVGGKTAIQNIDAICFSQEGLLRTEFDNLYSSLFTHPERYEKIVEILATTWRGMSRKEIIKHARLKDGGGITTILQELEQSGFITAYIPFQKKKKNTLYRLTDNYSLFYLKFIKTLPPNMNGNWITLSQTQSWKYWSGYAFENICLQHIEKIKTKLGIAGIQSQVFSFLSKGTDELEGTQIDLLIDRTDNAISLCEIKFYNDHYLLSKNEADKIRKKRTLFRHFSKTKKQIFLVLITTFGMLESKHSVGLIDNEVRMEDLF